MLAFIASQLTSEEEKKDLDKTFKAMDLDGDGTLSKEEVLLGFEKHLGRALSPSQVDEMFARIDLDGNGSIDYTEFIMATINEQKLLTKERLAMAFKTFDTDNSGSLSLSEIRAMLSYD